MESWDEFIKRLGSARKRRRRPRLEHRQSIALDMTMDLYEGVNRLPGFQAALADYFANPSERALVALIQDWSLPPRYAAKDVEWSKRLWAAGAPLRLHAGMRSFPGLERGEERRPDVWRRKGYELVPPPLASRKLRRSGAAYLLARLLGRFSYLTIATKAGKSTSTVFGVVQTWATRLGYPRDAV